MEYKFKVVPSCLANYSREQHGAVQFGCSKQCPNRHCYCLCSLSLSLFHIESTEAGAPLTVPFKAGTGRKFHALCYSYGEIK